MVSVGIRVVHAGWLFPVGSRVCANVLLASPPISPAKPLESFRHGIGLSSSLVRVMLKLAIGPFLAVSL